MTRTSLASALACAAVALTVCAAPGYAAERVNPTPPLPGHTARLSDERKTTLSAYVAERRPIYRKPRTSSRQLGRLHFATEDGYAEVYLVLARYTDPQGREWTQIRIPGRPNGRIGWVRRQRSATTARRIGASSSTGARGGSPCSGTASAAGGGRSGSASPARPRRPAGSGSASGSRCRPQSPYWPYALGTADYSTLSEWPGGGVVGIHGDWNQPH